MDFNPAGITPTPSEAMKQSRGPAEAPKPHKTRRAKTRPGVKKAREENWKNQFVALAPAQQTEIMDAGPRAIEKFVRESRERFYSERKKKK